MHQNLVYPLVMVSSIELNTTLCINCLKLANFQISEKAQCQLTGSILLSHALAIIYDVSDAKGRMYLMLM